MQERVQRLAARLQKWVRLRRTATRDRKVAIMLYGFPPGVGAAGTAALLNVPRSLEVMLGALREEGYDLGHSSDPIDGEAIVAALTAQAWSLFLLGWMRAYSQMSMQCAWTSSSWCCYRCEMSRGVPTLRSGTLRQI